ncbi:unnamed protein product [Adineta ricciae]|uniref:EF-hand domain-containing protein n=1 Tax=Adineta ricciae TaxID=249248 RepID=A0A816B9D1_ADIRI|nr:unnamed protein product [Adineta ricciae]CAF1607300.1 unnamed protein product [Adineta ricciae]
MFIRYLLPLLFSVYCINAHGQHSPSSTDGPQHISRKMEDHVHDMNHMKHDLEHQIDKPIEKMTPEEQNFYYFKLHDANNDNRLDGLEVIAAFDHTHEENSTQNAATNPNNNTHNPRLPDEELTNIIDDILKEEDLNRDGFISYEEFKYSLERNAATHG